MISIIMDATGLNPINWFRGQQWHQEHARKHLQEKFDKGKEGGIDIRGSEIKADTAQKIKKARLDPLEKENTELRKKISNGLISKPNLPTEEKQGIVSKVAGKAVEYAPYAAVVGAGIYGAKKLMDRKKQQPSTQSTTNLGGY